jgi:hypothetical protein
MIDEKDPPAPAVANDNASVTPKRSALSQHLQTLRESRKAKGGDGGA